MPDEPNISPVLDTLPDLLARFERPEFDDYVEELLKWNPQLGLVSKKSTPRIVARLVRRSVELWDFAVEYADLETGGRVVDVGSGGGFPGIVWKLMSPDLEVTLVDRKERKASFLTRVVTRLAIGGLHVIDADVFDIVRRERFRGAFDCVTMMAVAAPEEMAGPVESLLRPGGFFATMRGSDIKIIPDRIGDTLTVAASSAFDEGVFLLYKTPLA